AHGPRAVVCRIGAAGPSIRDLVRWPSRSADLPIPRARYPLQCSLGVPNALPERQSGSISAEWTAGRETEAGGARPAAGIEKRAACAALSSIFVRGRGRGGYLRLVLNWFRCVVQSEPPVAFVAHDPCQPHTQVMVCSRCLYWSITC